MSEQVKRLNGASVSVVIPLYNAEKYIAETLDSVYAQTYPVSEIVIVNDGSTDHSLAVIERVRVGHPDVPVRVVNQNNQGVDVARTVAVEQAVNNHVITLDADDKLHTKAVERWIAHALRHPQYALIYGDYGLIDEHGKVTGEVVHRNRRMDPLEGNVLATMLWENLTGSVNYVRRDAVLAVGGYMMDKTIFETNRLQDVYLNFKLLLAGYEFGYVPHTVFYYRNTPGSLSKQGDRQRVTAFHQVMGELFRRYPHEMAAAFVKMRQWRAEQLRDAFFTLEARDRQIHALESAIHEQAERIERLDAALREAKRYSTALKTVLAIPQMTQLFKNRR